MDSGTGSELASYPYLYGVDVNDFQTLSFLQHANRIVQREVQTRLMGVDHALERNRLLQHQLAQIEAEGDWSFEWTTSSDNTVSQFGVNITRKWVPEDDMQLVRAIREVCTENQIQFLARDQSLPLSVRSERIQLLDTQVEVLDDEFIARETMLFQTSDWESVVRKCSSIDRDAQECSHRWSNFLSYQLKSSLEPFTDEEDQLIRNVVNQQFASDTTNVWLQCEQMLEGRTAFQCLKHFVKKYGYPAEVADSATAAPVPSEQQLNHVTPPSTPAGTSSSGNSNRLFSTPTVLHTASHYHHHSNSNSNSNSTAAAHDNSNGNGTASAGPTPVGKQAWTQAEDRALTQAIKEYGLRWSIVASHVEGRSAQACLQRWTRHLNREMRKGSWQKWEDKRLIKAIAYFRLHADVRMSLLPQLLDQQSDDTDGGNDDDEEDDDDDVDLSVVFPAEEDGKIRWTAVAAAVGCRTDLQCRERYTTLKRKHTATPWSEQEDHTLLELLPEYQLQNNVVQWGKLSTRLPGRTGKQCRYRYLILQNQKQGRSRTKRSAEQVAEQRKKSRQVRKPKEDTSRRRKTAASCAVEQVQQQQQQQQQQAVMDAEQFNRGLSPDPPTSTATAAAATATATATAATAAVATAVATSAPITSPTRTSHRAAQKKRSDDFEYQDG